jgi:predicted helicase
LAEAALKDVEFTEISPAPDLYMFASEDALVREEYYVFPKMTEIFPINVLGFQTHRDDFAVGFDRAQIQQRISDLRNAEITDQALRDRYKLKDNRDWNLANARKALNGQSDFGESIIECDYRPFDIRWCHFGYETMDYPRREILTNVAWKENLCLEVSRQVRSSEWRHAFISSRVPESCLVSLQSREGNSALPMWLYQGASLRKENISSEFRCYLDARYDHHYSPEEIFGYTYAVLHAPAYRSRYAEFLRLDFPRIPFPEDAADFEALSKLGWALIEAHLLRDVPPTKLAQYHGKGDHMVEAVRYAPAEQAVWINKTQCFKPVPQAVWDFHIGGYQVLEKYLKSRKGRVLSLDEINHVASVAASLAFTSAQMAQIDKAYGKAFPAVDKPN